MTNPNAKPNAYVVIAFTNEKPKNLGQFKTEKAGRKAYDACEHAYLAAQIQVDVKLGAKGGQTPVWGEYK